MQTVSQQFEACSLIKVFEILTTDKRTGEDEYITFDIEIDGSKFIAQHVALSTEQEQSNKIAFVSIEIDEDFTLDENLQELFDECHNSVLNSEFFEIRN